MRAESTTGRRIRRLLVLGLAAGAFAGAADAHALTLSGTVSDVVDGDTVKVVVRGFETPVRLLGIDTPETRDPRKPVQCFGPQASARTARLLPVGRRVRLVTDPTQDERDRYARLLAYVYTPGKSGPRGSVNFTLVATGHAKVYVYGGERFTHAVPFFRAQHRARKVRNGLWGPPCRGNTTKPDPTARESAPRRPGGHLRRRGRAAIPTTPERASRPLRPTSTAARSRRGTSAWWVRTSTTSTWTATGSPARSERDDGDAIASGVRVVIQGRHPRRAETPVTSGSRRPAAVIVPAAVLALALLAGTAQAAPPTIVVTTAAEIPGRQTGPGLACLHASRRLFE